VRSLIGGVKAKAPIPYAPTRASAFTSGTTMGAGNSGPSAAQLASMGSVGTLFSIVGRITESLALVDWHLYRKARPGQPPEERTEVTRHAALDLWDNPNPHMPRQEFVETFSQHLELTGEAWWVISKAGSLPLELWPVRPDRMRPIPSVEKFIAGYSYRSPDGDDVPLDADEVVFIRRPNPLDVYRGMGAVQSVMTDIDSARFSAEWNRSFFLNSAEPGGIIQVDKRLSDDEFTEMVTRWREQHQGVSNAHRVAVLEQGTWIDRKYSMRDMQFSELRGVSREILREAFGISKTMLGESEDVNRATAETAEVVFARWLLVGRLARIKMALNYDLLPLYGGTARELEFDYESPIPPDEEQEQKALTAKAGAASILVSAGWDPDQVLETVGLPPMEHTKAAPPVIQAPPAVEEPEPDPAPSEDDAPPTGDDTSDEDAADAKLTDALRRAVAAEVRAHLGHDRGHSPVAAVIPPPPVPAPPTDGTPATLPEDATQDPQAIQDQWETVVAALIVLWLLHSSGDDDARARSRWGVAGIAGSLVEQVHTAVLSGDLLALTRLKVDTQAAGDALGAALVEAGQAAARHVVTEAAAQGVSIGTGIVDRRALESTGHLAAATLADGLRLTASREAARVWGPGITADTVAEHVADALTTLTPAQPEYVLGGAATAAEAAGREATILAGPSAALYAQEVNDRNQCRPCADIDGRWLGNSDDPTRPWRALYPVRGYIACLGRDRCRGVLVATWRGGTDWKKWTEKEPVERSST
jgi:HK97 family phage portal protein